MIGKSAKVGKLHLAERHLNQEKTPLKVNVNANVNVNVSTQKLGRDYSMSTVMVVDDSVTLREMIADLLKGRGLNVTVASDGVEALEQIKANRPDLVVLDIVMPRMNGYEVCRRLKSDPKTQNLPSHFTLKNWSARLSNCCAVEVEEEGQKKCLEWFQFLLPQPL
jgi:CheY-like chemotaxis protein